MKGNLLVDQRNKENVSANTTINSKNTKERSIESLNSCKISTKEKKGKLSEIKRKSNTSRIPLRK